MGYHNLKAGHNTLQKFLDAKDIYHWLKTGNFDIKYGSEAFLRALVRTLGLPAVIAEDEILEAQKRLEVIEGMKQPYIFIDTHFKRKGEPVFMLAMLEGRRNIVIDKELLVYKSKKEILEEIGKVIRDHYFSSNGNLQVWGDIDLYVYHHIDGSKYVFNSDGLLSSDHDEISELRAEIWIGNQRIDFI
ncbi:MAG TPA: hypothetical protein ENK72_02660 [Epsilonproteobacteria bacterium]|nr:hypothetical protein [Campylobacterota bacterium]